MADTVIICGNPKSGTTLLQALLDWHDSLFVVPIELKYFDYVNLPHLPPGNFVHKEMGNGIPIPSVNPPSNEQVVEYISSVRDLGNLINGKLRARNINIDEGIDIEKLNKSLDEIGENGEKKELYKELLNSIKSSVKKYKNENVTIVEKTPHYEEFAQEIDCWFDNVFFIHVMRNPYANINSVRKNDVLVRSLRETYKMTAKSYYFMERNKKYIDSYKVIRFEDLVLDTENVIREVADYIDISFSKSLLKPTILGRPWRGNSNTQSSDFTGIDPRPVSAFEGNMHPFDKAVINRFFSPILKKYDYKLQPTSNWKAWLPAGWEHPVSYVRNRYLLFDDYL